jgi:HlyD family secretion protein
MKKLVVALLIAGAVTVGAGAYYTSRGTVGATVSEAAITTGDILATVSATGTLQAVTTVQVGTQVSGSIAWLGADFNSIVRKGQVIARLEPSLLQAQVEQARANLTRAEADVDRMQVQLMDARQKFARTEELTEKQLLARSEFDAARTAVASAEAQVKSAEAQAVQARASLNQTLVNLDHTVIAAPIDGIVIQRSVDVGQTVAASLQSPTVFAIAADLTDMQVNASIDESDIGRVSKGQPVAFTVDAYPGEWFTGVVAQVRLQPSVVQNVTTYSVIVDAPNPELKLKPGMTASLTFEIARRDDVLRVPAAALRFAPTAAMFAALDQAPEKPARAGPNVWQLTDGLLKPVAVTLGLSDGGQTELVSANLAEGTPVVTGVSIDGASTRSTATSAGPGAAGNPFMGMTGGPRR